jgi:hypothetical protein
MAKVKFQVVLENIELNKTQVAAIQKEINSVVSKSLLKARLTTPVAGLPSSLGFKIMPEWFGIWIKKFKTPDLIKTGGFSVLK